MSTICSKVGFLSTVGSPAVKQGTKQCSECLGYKELEEFGRRAASPDGLQYICKACLKDIVKRVYWEKRDEKIDYARQNYQKTKDSKQAYNVKYHNKHTEEHAARNVLNYNLRMGRVTKPDCCFLCNKNVPLEAHHEDYAKPLEVNWLCRSCHSVIHKGT